MDTRQFSPGQQDIKQPHNAVARFFIDEVNAQKDIVSVLREFKCESLERASENTALIVEALERIKGEIVASSAIAAPFPVLCKTAFLILNRLAQMRTKLLDKDFSWDQVRAMENHLAELKDLLDPQEVLGRALHRARLSEMTRHVFDMSPFKELDKPTLDTAAFRNAVRERLVEITKLELAVMRYVCDDASGSVTY